MYIDKITLSLSPSYTVREQFSCTAHLPDVALSEITLLSKLIAYSPNPVATDAERYLLI